MKLRGLEHIHTADDQSIAITSLVLRKDTLWCGLTAGARCLVPFDLKAKKFGEAVNVFPWVEKRPQVVLSKIHNSLGMLGDGRLVIGEGILYTWDGVPYEVHKDEHFLLPGNERRAKGMCFISCCPTIVSAEYAPRTSPAG